jgi:hypothetical protein
MGMFFHVDNDEKKPEEHSMFVGSDFREATEREHKLSERSMFMSDDDDHDDDHSMFMSAD